MSFFEYYKHYYTLGNLPASSFEKDSTGSLVKQFMPDLMCSISSCFDPASSCPCLLVVPVPPLFQSLLPGNVLQI